MRCPNRLLLIALTIACTVPLTAKTPEEKLADLGITLPASSSAVANYVPSVRTGNLIFLAGHLPRDAEGNIITGRVPTTVDVPGAQAAAEQTALALIATLKAELGELSRVKRIVRVDGHVNSSADFTGQSAVINGCSNLLVAVFGERGRHARVALGANTLPLGTVVEIALIAEIE